jgi:hypothetical protein
MLKDSEEEGKKERVKEKGKDEERNRKKDKKGKEKKKEGGGGKKRLKEKEKKEKKEKKKGKRKPTSNCHTTPTHNRQCIFFPHLLNAFPNIARTWILNHPSSHRHKSYDYTNKKIKGV